MILSHSDRIFDTLVDTQQKQVFMKTTFYLRKDIIVAEKHPIYLRISGGDIKLTERINIGLYVSPKIWHVRNQRVYSNGVIELGNTT